MNNDPTDASGASSVSGAPLTVSRTGNDAFGVRDAFAASGLAAAQLKVRGSVSNLTSPLDSNGSAVAAAVIADSFRHGGVSGPFNWQSASTARFTLDIDGMMSRLGSNDDVNTSAFLELVVLEPGALDATTGPSFQDGAPLALNPAWTDRIIDRFTWGLTPQSTHMIDYENFFQTFGLVPVDEILTTFPQTVVADFTPGMDFDWFVRLNTSVLVNDGNASRFGTIDFANTINVAYTPPAGATTFSASGIFPGTTLVPEPSITALFFLCVSGLLVRTR